MKPPALLAFSWGNLRRRKLRTALTILGVMIGTASIVMMMSIGLGLDRQVTQQITGSVSLNLISIYNYSYNIADSSDSAPALTQEVIDGFSAMEHVTAASPVYEFNMQARCGSYEGFLFCQAMRYEMLTALGIPILQGNMLEPGQPLAFMVGRDVGFNFWDASGDPYFYYDSMSDPPVDLMGSTVYVTFEDSSSPTYQTKKYRLEVAAMLGVPREPDAYGNISYTQFDYGVYADLDAVESFFEKLYKKNPWPGQSVDKKGRPVRPMTYNTAYVLADDVENVMGVLQEIRDMGYEVQASVEWIQQSKDEMRTIQYALGGIGSISLLVAALGITNTMVMSILERTREIGIFKVLGCTLPAIRNMFLTEAALIGLIGGVLGLLISLGLSSLLNLFAGGISYISPQLALGGVAVAVGVGLVAGISPAIRAMRLSPLEAIRSN